MTDGNRSVRSSLLARFRKHHDLLSIKRQRELATTQLVVNVLVVGLYLAAIHAWHWKLKLAGVEDGVCLALWAFSLVLLTISSQVMIALIAMRGGWGFGPGRSVAPEPAILSSYRKWVYYPAVYFNIIAIAVFVEETGGLVKSPFSPVLFALVLGAQALSRFRPNSRNYIVAGVVITGCLYLIEQALGTRNVPDPPRALSFWTVAAVFLVTALVTHGSKSRNYKAAGGFPAASSVELYGDPGSWRFALYCDDNTKLDPLLELVPGQDTFADAQAKVEQLALAGNSGMRIYWWESRDKREALGQIDG